MTPLRRFLLLATFPASLLLAIPAMAAAPIRPNLTASLTVSPDVITAGEVSTIVATMANTGERKAISPFFNVVIPGDLPYSFMAPAGGTCTQSLLGGTRLFICMLTALPPGKSRSLTLRVTGVEVGEPVVSTVSMTADPGHAQPETSEADNEAVATLTLNP